MNILTPKSRFLADIPAHFKGFCPKVSLADLADGSAPVNPSTIFVTQDMEAKEVAAAVASKKISYLLQANALYFLDDIETVADICENPPRYFSRQGICLLKNQKKNLQLEFSIDSDKKNLRDQCMKFIDDNQEKNVGESLEAIFEELYMNATLDAPKEALKGSGAEGRVPEKSKMTLVLSRQRMAIACCDPYGSLDIEKFLSRLNEVYLKGAGEAMNMNREGGAGIGCSLLFENSSSLFLGVVPGKMTVVSCLIPLGLNYRQRAEIGKSLCLIRG